MATKLSPTTVAKEGLNKSVQRQGGHRLTGQTISTVSLVVNDFDELPQVVESDLPFWIILRGNQVMKRVF